MSSIPDNSLFSDGDVESISNDPDGRPERELKIEFVLIDLKVANNICLPSFLRSALESC